MKHKISKHKFHLFVFVCMATITLSTLRGESRCPGNIASVTPRIVQRALLVIPVMIDESGPFDFMVDTGSQVTVIDPSLALELKLPSQGSVRLVSVASYAQASVTVLETLEAGSQMVNMTPAVIQDLGQVRAADPRIRGVLGESFLAHFDLLIDYAHGLLCLDHTGSMRNRVHGEHIPLMDPQRQERELQFMERLVVSVHLSGAGAPQILLQLDSGSDGPILYPTSDEKRFPLPGRATPREGNLTEAQKAFADLPPQELRIGKRTISHVSFVTPLSAGKNVPGRDEDGLLPTLLFQRVFICGAEHYVVFDPR
jgi:Aspartyl protease